jgi:inner membrane protein
LDSLTQIALGAAVGEATLGRKVGNRAILWGAVCGTVPDLDVFIPFGDAVRDFVYHRGFSHSLFVLAMLTPLFAWLIVKFHPHTARYYRGWLLLVYLAFATHVLLDSFTIYGTQIFWPFYTTPMTWGTIFIIDPAYTLPLLIGVTCALIAHREKRWGYRMNTAGLVLSSLYLAWTVGAKFQVESIAREALAKQGIEYSQLLALPGPFNSVLWRLVVMDDRGYREGWYSLLDGTRDIRFSAAPSKPELLQGIEDHWPVQRLRWFTKGFYSVSRVGTDVVITDLRMGWEPEYVFSFKVGEIGNPHAQPATPARLPVVRTPERLGWIMRRIWTESP